MKVLNFYHLGKKIPDGAVYIGRSMPHLGLSGSLFANPFKLSKSLTGDQAHAERLDVLQKYRRYLFNKIQNNEITLDDLIALKDHDLVCFCAPRACHGDVLKLAVKWACEQRGISLDDVNNSNDDKGLGQ